MVEFRRGGYGAPRSTELLGGTCSVRCLANLWLTDHDKTLLSDALWAIIEPLIPCDPPKPKGGRPRVPARQVLTGILFVLKTGIQWEWLPQELDYGSGMTCWRRVRDWQATGVWDDLHRVLLDHLGRANRIDWSRACLDSGSVPAPGGGSDTGPNPTDRGKSGSKRHRVVDAQGIPLAIRHTAANVHDSTMFEQLVDAIPDILKPRGRPRRRPTTLHADKGYDYPRCHRALKQRRIESRIARRTIESRTRLGRHRWVVERTLAWLKGYRRLRIRYERRSDIHHAFLSLACARICWRVLGADSVP
jgi:transposase